VDCFLTVARQMQPGIPANKCIVVGQASVYPGKGASHRQE
jgi:hypothetical protein